MINDIEKLQEQLSILRYQNDALQAENERLKKRLDAMKEASDWQAHCLHNTEELLEKYKAAYFDILLDF